VNKEVPEIVHQEVSAVKQRRFAGLPLRGRFVLWQVAVLAPFLLTALIGQFYVLPALMGPLEVIANEVSVEVIQLKDLQVKLEIAAMPVNDYLIHGDSEEVEAFAKDRRQVEQSFERVRAIRFGEAEERQLVDQAWQEWQLARTLADDLFSRKGLVGAAAAQVMKQFDTRIDRAVGLLEQVYVVSRDEMEEAKEKAHVARARAVWITVVAFVLALAVSLMVGSTLASSIVSGVDALRKGSARLATGDLSQRVIVTGVHELEELAGAYNVMAERLQSHEAALRDLATHDALTQLENRRAFETHLNEEMTRAERYDHPLALFMIDIDHFKNVNDTYGHPAGDLWRRGICRIGAGNGGRWRCGVG